MIIEHQQLNLSKKMIFEKAVLCPPFRIPNSMPNEACFIYVLEGEQKVYSSTAQDNIRANEGMLLKCGMYFSDWLTSNQYDTCEAIAVHFYPEVLKEIYQNEIPSFIKSVQSNVTMQKIVSNELIKKFIESMVFYFENPSLVTDDLIVLKLKELILLLTKTENGPQIIELMSSLFSPKEYSFKDIINANIYSNFTVEQLASLTNLSLSSFKREFKKIYNDSPGHYIRMKKMTKAAELLLHTDNRVSDVAYDSGFNDVANFSKAFQAEYGTSPSNYRLNQNNKSLG